MKVFKSPLDSGPYDTRFLELNPQMSINLVSSPHYFQYVQH